jgi:MoxR-vWA-beta-propeller ternary system domain bpX5
MRAVGLAPRAAPLTPGAVLALGDGARALARRLLSRSDEQLARLRAVVGPELLLVLGAEDELPWADGAVYLAREPDAPELWLPCAVGADAPAPLLLRALKARFQSAHVEPPYAVSLAPPRVVSLEREQPLKRETLLTFTAREKA